jgi:hypothetical protein
LLFNGIASKPLISAAVSFVLGFRNFDLNSFFLFEDKVSNSSIPKPLLTICGCKGCSACCCAGSAVAPTSLDSTMTFGEAVPTAARTMM